MTYVLTYVRPDRFLLGFLLQTPRALFEALRKYLRLIQILELDPLATMKVQHVGNNVEEALRVLILDIEYISNIKLPIPKFRKFPLTIEPVLYAQQLSKDHPQTPYQQRIPIILALLIVNVLRVPSGVDFGWGVGVLVGEEVLLLEDEVGCVDDVFYLPGLLALLGVGRETTHDVLAADGYGAVAGLQDGVQAF